MGLKSMGWGGGYKLIPAIFSRNHPVCRICLAVAALWLGVGAAQNAARAQDFVGGGQRSGGLPFVPAMFGDARQSYPDGIPSSRGAEKIAENDSPWIADRVYFNWNYYHDVHGFWDHINRETIGIEKSIFDGNASLGVRLPFFQVNFEGPTPAIFPPGVETSAVGDLILIGKLALIQTPDTVFSTGMVVGVPTGPNADLFNDVTGEEIHSTTLQPFLGYGQVWGNTYVHGFSSLLVPTDSGDVTILFNDVGVGYWFDLGDGMVQAVAPTAEVHVNVPLNHRADFVDSVVLMFGANIVLQSDSTIGLAIGPNVSGPQLFEFETQVTFNWRF